MKKRLISMIVLAALLTALLAACGSGSSALTAEEAQQAVMKHAGTSASQVSDIHTHITTGSDGEPCYSIHITIDGVSYEYLVHGITGEILSYGEGGH